RTKPPTRLHIVGDICSQGCDAGAGEIERQSPLTDVYRIGSVYEYPSIAVSVILIPDMNQRSILESAERGDPSDSQWRLQGRMVDDKIRANIRGGATCVRVTDPAYFHIAILHFGS